MHYKWIGWMHENNSDKVWGIIVLEEPILYREGKYCSFWGRRGKKLQTKIFSSIYWKVDDMISAKKRKNYIEVDQEKLDEVYPEFKKDLEKTSFWAALRM